MHPKIGGFYLGLFAVYWPLGDKLLEGSDLKKSTR